MIRRLLSLGCLALVGWLALPFIGGLYYTYTGDHGEEQGSLDRAVAHLRTMRLHCTDPDLQGVLDYTIQRYSRIGPWDVMIFPAISMRGKTIGVNAPWCPGITIDPVLIYNSDTRLLAMTLVHEALHDYWPYFGHAHVTPVEERLEKL